MIRKFLPCLLALVLCIWLATPALAFTSADILGGAPSGITESHGTLLITDTYHKIIWQVKDDAVSRFAGQISIVGLNGEPIGKYEDGTLTTALFMEPWDIVPFLDGWAVSDAQANVVRYVDALGVRTAAGNGRPGKADGVGEAVSFDRPTGLATDENGMLYIADTGNGSIRRLDTQGQVTTILTGLSDPTGLCWANGSLYIVETGRSRILRMTGSQTEVLAGESVYLGDGEYEGNYVDGPVEQARFDHPQGIAVDTDGTVYIADTGNHAVRRLANGQVSTILAAGQMSQAPVQPRGLLLQGTTLLVTDPFAQQLLQLDTESDHVSDHPQETETLPQETDEEMYTSHTPVIRAVFMMMSYLDQHHMAANSPDSGLSAQEIGRLVVPELSESAVRLLIRATVPQAEPVEP